MGDNLSTDLASAISFSAGGLVSGALTMKAPEDGTYYVLVEQYTSALAFLPGTRSYLYQAVADGTGVNSTVNYTTYELVEDEEEDVNFNLTLAYTDCYLYLFLKKMAGDTPAPDTDDTVDYVAVALSAPVAPVTTAELDISSIMNMMIMLVVVVMMMKMMTKVTE